MSGVVVGATKWQFKAELSNFQGKVAYTEVTLHSKCPKTWLKPWPSDITNALGGNFQQYFCLYKQTSGIQWTL